MTVRRSLRLVLVFVFSLSAPVLSTQQSPPAEVSILLSATDKYNRVVTNLRKEDIRIRDEGSLRPITRFESAGDLPISIEVLIDTSGSTKNQSAVVPVLAKLFLAATIRKEKDTATITSFGSSVKLVQSPTDDVPQLYSAIDEIVMQPAVGRTPLYSTILAAADRLALVPGRRIVLLISDGFDNSENQALSKKMRITLQKNEVAVYPMYCFCGPTLPGEPKPLRMTLDSNWGTWLSESTGGTTYLPGTGDAQTIERDLRQIARQIAAQRVVSFQTVRRKDDAALRKIRIEVANPEMKGSKFKYRQRY